MRRHFNLADLFELVVDKAPDNTALVAGDARLSYRELDERANRFASHVRSVGLEPGDKVAICSWNRAEWVEAMIGSFKARVVPINVNYRYTAEELRYVLDNCDAAALVTEEEFVPVLEQLRGDLPLLREVMVIGDDYEAKLAAASPERSDEERSGDDLYMIYTGGTTGMPKGVMWRQEDAFFACMGGGGFYQPPIETPEEIQGRVAADPAMYVSMITAPMMHAAAQWSGFAMFFAGGQVCLWTGHHLDPHAIWKIVEQERCTTMTVVGDAIARPLVEALDEPGVSYDTSSLFNLGSGGAILSDAVKEQLRAKLPNIMISDSFGSSEVGAQGRNTGEASGPRFATMDDTTTVLGDDLRPVKPGSGEVGRVARRGHIPLGYYKDEAKTTATFVTDPDGVRWALPGDFGMIEDDGAIVLLGRGSQCINTGGEKVFPEEVEAALKSHPDVFDAVVVGVHDARFGERVAAIVQPRDGRSPGLDDLASHCRQHVAGYKVPRQVHLVEEIARTPAGKPDYRKAKALLE
jgi:3-oxocholest-4-en-26-oate---CoA ligase